MMFRKIITLISFLTALCVLAGVSLAAPKAKKDLGMRSGLIQNPQLIYDSESGKLNDLQLTVVLPKSLDALWTGEADAWLVIWMTSDEDGQTPIGLTKVQLTAGNAKNGNKWSRNHPRNLVKIGGSDLQNLQKGDYQIGLILTYKNSTDPTALGNWYGGFSGLVSVSRFKITLGSDTSTGQDSGSGSTEGGGGVVAY
jgi:hypothetical protein